MVQHTIPCERKKDNFLETGNTFNKQHRSPVRQPTLVSFSGISLAAQLPALLAFLFLDQDNTASYLYLHGMSRTMDFSSSTWANTDNVSVISSSVVW